jgi:hypothetical protein
MLYPAPPPIHLVTGHCYQCRGHMQVCHQCVTTVLLDPVTMLPPDVYLVDGRAVRQQGEPDPAAIARAVRMMVCQQCVERVNAARPPAARLRTYEQVHGQHLRARNFALC